MAFDSSVVRCFVHEANNLILNSKIDKIHQPQKDELCISLRLNTGSTKLYLSANPSYPRIFLTNGKTDNPMSPPMFCMLMRKHLTGGKIVNITQHEFERVIIFEIETYNDLMDRTIKKLIIEVMGKHSNIILTEHDNTIIDSIKRIDISTSAVRQVLPGLKYILPPTQDKIDPLLFDKSMLCLPDTDVEKFVITKFSGISKLTASEIAYRTRFQRIYDVIDEIFENVRHNIFTPCIVYDSSGEILDFSAIHIKQFNSDYKIEYYNTISEVIEIFYNRKALKMRIIEKTSQLSKVVSNNIARCKKKLSIFENQLADSAKRDKYMQYGELITANCYKFKDNVEYIDVENYYDPELKIIRIPLDSSLSPSKNAQKYYTKYNKLKTAETQALQWIKIVTDELAYLESVLDEINRTESVDDIKEIKNELIEQGYINAVTVNKKKNEEVSKPKKILYNDYEIYVGKNNKQNDYLTLKIARSNDLWFHTKNIPGSHVIISKKANEEIPDNVILKAAKLAALHSKAKGTAKTPVDYTIVKNVKKPSKAKPGMVIYDNYNTIYVNP